MSVERHLRGHEVADLLGLHYETVMHLAQTGEIETVRVGRLRLFPESAVNAYLNRNVDTSVVVPFRPRVAASNNQRGDAVNVDP